MKTFIIRVRAFCGAKCNALEMQNVKFPPRVFHRYRGFA
jgi:hypothetical protein